MLAVVGALAGAALGLLAPACGARTGLPVPLVDASVAEDAEVEPEVPEDVIRPLADRIDLLFMIDNSGSMADKQEILSSTVPDMIGRLINPLCVDVAGQPAAPQPGSWEQACPPGTQREFNPVLDIHIAFVSSSLGGHGADRCSAAMAGYNETMEDMGRLVTRGPYGGTVPTYQKLGFLAWDPAGTKEPPGEGNETALRKRLSDLVRGVGESGCGAEAQLEAWYRFLVDPEPYAYLDRVDCDPGTNLFDCVKPEGIDSVILKQRRDFLRPDSLLAVIMLTDENDCSVIDGDKNYRVLQYFGDTGETRMPRATSVCASSPGDPCCHSCADPPPPGCPNPAADPTCQLGLYDAFHDSQNLRCFQQKRRFGTDFLWPIERYTRGLTDAEVPDRDGDLVPNPIFSNLGGGDTPPRHPSLVFLAGIVGVPWQDLAVDPDDPSALTYKTAKQIAEQGLWDVIVGDPAGHVPPTDPFMVESVDPRTGVNPVTGDAIGPPGAPEAMVNPINGHELDPAAMRFEPQYACIFDLPEPRDCGNQSGYCDCSAAFDSLKKPTCQGPDGSYGHIQYRAKAYPGLRQLAVLKGLGDNAVVASICARNVTDPSRPDYGYRPALGAILERLRLGLE